MPRRELEKTVTALESTARVLDSFNLPRDGAEYRILDRSFHIGNQYWDTHMNASILDFLKTNGERLDAEIAEALQMPMAMVTSHVSQLSAAGEVICCKVTRYVDGKKIEGVSCRLSCNVPAPARGRKPGAKRDATPETNLP